VCVCAGIQVSHGVAYHGLALNCSTDLSWFRHIVPCGVTDKDITSLSELCKRTVCPQDIQSHLVQSLAKTLNFELSTSDCKEVGRSTDW